MTRNKLLKSGHCLFLLVSFLNVSGFFLLLLRISAAAAVSRWISGSVWCCRIPRDKTCGSPSAAEWVW